MKVPLRNLSGKPLGVMLEPWTDTVELAPGQEAEIDLTSKIDPGEFIIDINEDNFVSLWVPPGATIRVIDEGR